MRKQVLVMAMSANENGIYEREFEMNVSLSGITSFSFELIFSEKWAMTLKYEYEYEFLIN